MAEDMSQQILDLLGQVVPAEGRPFDPVDIQPPPVKDIGTEVSDEWRNFITNPKFSHDSTAQVSKDQKSFIDWQKKRFDWMSEQEFTDMVVKPVADTTMQDSRFFPDFQIPTATRVMFAIRRALPDWAKAFSDIVSGSMEVKPGLLSETGFEPMKQTPQDEPDEISMGDAIGMIENQIQQESRKSSILQYAAEQVIPDVTRWTLNALTLKKLGVPAGFKDIEEPMEVAGKTLAPAITQASRPVKALVTSLKTAELLGAVSAVDNLSSYKTNPEQKLKEIMDSAGFGLIVGPASEYLRNPLMRIGAISSLVGAQTYFEEQKAGSSFEDSAKSVMKSLTTLLGFELTGFIENIGKARELNRMVDQMMLSDIRAKHPQMDIKEAKMHAAAIKAGIQQELLGKFSDRVMRPFLDLEAQGKLTPTEKRTLSKLRNRFKEKADKTTKVVASTEKYLKKRIGIRYPGNVQEPVDFFKIGNQMAKDLGVNPDRLEWLQRSEADLTASYKKSHPNYKGKVHGFTRFDEETGKWRLLIATDTGDLEVRKTMIEELVHSFTPGIQYKNRLEAHHKEFKARQSVAEQLLKPIEETKKIGRKAAKEAEKSLEKKSLIANVQKEIKAQHVSKDEFKALLYDATGKTDPGPIEGPNVSNEQIAKILNNLKRMSSSMSLLNLELEHGITKNEATSLMKKSKGNPTVYARVLSGIEGQLPKEGSYWRKRKLLYLEQKARDMVKHEGAWNRIHKWERLRWLHPNNLESSRNFFDQISRVSGKPILALKDGLEEMYKRGVEKYRDFASNLIKASGASESQMLKLNSKEIADLATYLHDRKATSYEVLTPEAKAAASAIKGAMDEGGPVANQIRSIIWKRLNLAFSKVQDAIGRELLKPTDKQNKKRIAALVKRYERFAPSDIAKAEVVPFGEKPSKGPKQAYIKPATKEEKAAENIKVHEAIKRIVIEGRAAMDAGKFDDWISKQAWGTRKFYYMTEHDWDNYSRATEELLAAPNMDFWEKKMKRLKIDFSALHPRKAEGEVDTVTNPWVRAKKHAYRAYTLNSIFDQFEKFNNAATAIEDILTPFDRTMIDSYRAEMMGRGGKAPGVTRFLQKIGNAWWSGYSWQPTNVAWFAWRNLFQNPAMLPSQVSITEYGKALGRMTSRYAKTGVGISDKAMKDYNDWYGATISQRRQKWEAMVMEIDPKTAQIPGVVNLLTIGREGIALSDDLNRKIAFWPIHEMAEKNIELLKSGKLTQKQFANRMKLHTLNYGHGERLLDLLATKQYDEFTKWYTTYKVQNAHFVYDTFGRSIAELDPTARQLIGLSTWPRGAAEAWWHQVLKPIVKAPVTKDYAAAYEGCKNLVGTVAGLYIAQKGLENSFGIRGYGFGPSPYSAIGTISYEPIGPGLGWAIEAGGFATGILTDLYNMTSDMEDYRNNGKTPAEYFDKWLTRGARQIEYMIPLVDVLDETFDKMNDKDGTTFYHVLKELVSDYDIRRDKNLKDNRQGLVNKFRTAVMGTKLPEEEREMQLIRSLQ